MKTWKGAAWAVSQAVFEPRSVVAVHRTIALLFMSGDVAEAEVAGTVTAHLGHALGGRADLLARLAGVGVFMHGFSLGFRPCLRLARSAQARSAHQGAPSGR